MLKRCTKMFVWSSVFLCVVPLAISPFRSEAMAAGRPKSIVVQIEVIDKGTANAIDNAAVWVDWGQRGSDTPDATTNSRGIAKLMNVPLGKVAIKVIAGGYKVGLRSVDLKKEKQPIKIELDKE